MRRWILLPGLLLVLAAASPVAAQEGKLPHPSQPLEPRQAARSGYAPQGLRLGAVQVYPEVVAGRTLRQEAFARPDAPTQRAWISHVDGTVKAEARGGPWAAEARGELSHSQGPRVLVGDGSEGAAALDLRLGIGRLAVAQAEAGWRYRLEPRVAPLSAEQAAEPVPVQILHGGLGLRSERGPVTAALQAGVQRLVHEDVARLGGAEILGDLDILHNDDRDRDVAALTAEVAWRPGEMTALYLRGSVAALDYDRDEDDFGRRRDATTQEALVGVAYGRPDRWRAFVELGHMARQGEDPVLPDVSSLAVNAGLTVAVTPLITARVLVQSTIAETTEQASSAVVVRRGLLEMEHEAMRNIILLTTAEASQHEYMGSDRTDTALSYGSGVRWRIGPVLRVELMARQEQLLAGWEADSYQATTTTLALGARF